MGANQASGSDSTTNVPAPGAPRRYLRPELLVGKDDGPSSHPQLMREVSRRRNAPASVEPAIEDRSAKRVVNRELQGPTT